MRLIPNIGKTPHQSIQMKKNAAWAGFELYGMAEAFKDQLQQPAAQEQ